MTTNFYPIKCNPCALCIADKEKVDTNTAGGEDLLDFSLEGKYIGLAVKERSTTKLKGQRAIDNVEGRTVNTPTAGLSGTTSALENSERSPTITSPKENLNNKLSNINLDTIFKKAEQNMKLPSSEIRDNEYFEETIRNNRLDEYWRDLQEARRKRELWKSFQKDIAKERKRDLINCSGPAWWQEPSRKQICLAVSLEAVITADHEEIVTGRTRQWLLDLGVTTRLTPKQVRGCMRRSLLDPIDFLLEAHSVILKQQLNVKKKRGDLEKPFSINERLLLSAICVLHLPTLLIMLHYMLPPPKPFSSSKHINELLFGDLNDDRIRYDSPYMEPLPFRSGKHFHDWAFDKVFRALFPSIYKAFQKDFGVKLKQPKTMALAKKSIMGVATQQTKNKCFATKKNEKTSMTPSVSWLITKCYCSNRPVSPSLKPCDEEESGQTRFYSRMLTRRTMRESTFLSNVPMTKEAQNGNTLHANDDSGVKNTTSPLDIEPSNTEVNEENIIKRSREYSAMNGLVKVDTLANKIRQSVLSESYVKPNIEKTVSYIDTKDNVDEPEPTKLSISTKSIENSIPRMSRDQETIHHFEEIPIPECKELNEIWSEIKDLPINQQLKHATKMLAEMGDPLAQLPQLHEIPAVKRWFEIRQGTRRILSESTKADLLMSSRGMWKMAPAGNTKEGPKIKCSKKTERMLTWDKKKWLEKEIRTETNNYFTRVKQEKVGNARLYFPSMLNHYDHGSKLNRNFRDVFFAYLPAREADTFVFRPS